MNTFCSLLGDWLDARGWRRVLACLVLTPCILLACVLFIPWTLYMAAIGAGL